MSNILPDLSYTRSDEWLRWEGALAVVGITDFAQEQLSSLVYLALPDVGHVFNAGDEFGTVESVKAVAELKTPLAGTVEAVNTALLDTPEELNTQPYANWLIKLKPSDPQTTVELLDAADYEQYCKGR
jgi:glycine cleavage system H protein